ncbi:MAG TPA: M56 family metallopeptidase [Chitinophagaceae bacterium]|nr:M56 family metallopeptidase [Chitinophagaceae bacterium]
MFLPGNNIMQAVSRTLIHSLWQGLIMAVLAGAIVVLTKKLRPATRYALFAGLLVCFLVTVTITFSHEVNVVGKKNAVVNILAQSPAVAASFTPVSAAAIPQKEPGFTEMLFAYFTAHANTIVFGWLLIIAFRCVQMMIGLRGVYTLKRKGIADAGDYWNERLKQLAANLHVKENIRLLQSVIAKVPMVIGHFKPVILLPAGIITALPQDEIEAILLHELAHIRRKDYLVNMLQNFCEIIFFFNPAVLWLSSLIKDERENCCDDIAVNAVKNKKQFIHALISFQEYNIAASKYAPGFPGKKDHLLNRVKRIITNNNKTLTNMEKTFLATGIVLVSFITIAFSQTKKQPVAHNKQQTAQQAAPGQEAADSIPPPENSKTTAVPPDNSAPDAADTVPPPKEDVAGNSLSLTTDYKGKNYRIIESNDKLVELWVDGEKIPEERFGEYKPTVDLLVTRLREQQKKFAYQQEQFKVQQDQFNKQAEAFKMQQENFKAQQKEFDLRQKEMLKLNDSVHSEQFKLQAQKFKEQMNEFKLQQDQYKLQQEQYKYQQLQYKQMADSLRKYSFDNFEMQEPAQPAEPPAPAAVAVAASPAVTANIKSLPAIAATPSVSVNNTVNVAPVPAVQAVPAVAQPNNIVIDILADLKDAGIKINDDDVSFHLNNKVLVVNGVTQTETLRAKLVKKYSINQHSEVKYMTNAGETISSVSTRLDK